MPNYDEEPFLAYKPFLYHDDRLYLPTYDKPISRLTVVKSGRCEFCGENNPPAEDCVCGMVSTLNPVDALKYVLETPHSVLLLVQVLGATVLEDDGFRLRSESIFPFAVVGTSPLRDQEYYMEVSSRESLASSIYDMWNFRISYAKYVVIGRYDNLNHTSRYHNLDDVVASVKKGNQALRSYIESMPCVSEYEDAFSFMMADFVHYNDGRTRMAI